MMATLSGYSTKLYYGATDGGTSANTYSPSDLSGGYEIDNSQLNVVSVSQEEADDQDEPDTGERPVRWQRPNRRLATVNRAGRNRRTPQQASTYG